MQEEKQEIKKRPRKSDRLLTRYLIVVVLLIGVLGFDFFYDITPSKNLQVLTGNYNTSTKKSDSVSSGDNLASPDRISDLESAVVPEEGFSVDVKWNDIGKKLVASGAIDMQKYQKNYQQETYEDLLTYLTDENHSTITITKENAYFWVNTLWALGLAQKSDVLDKGIMGTQYKDKVGNFASTGGWTLGSKSAVDIYSKNEILSLDSLEQQRVFEISKNIYRPCCGNPTSFPDCNHGMAILGLIELMVDQGFSDQDIYQAALAFNSYWFTNTYIDLAYYFEKEEGLSWSEVDAKRILSADFSSASGYQKIKSQIGNVPGAKSSGASCGA